MLQDFIYGKFAKHTLIALFLEGLYSIQEGRQQGNDRIFQVSSTRKRVMRLSIKFPQETDKEIQSSITISGTKKGKCYKGSRK